MGSRQLIRVFEYERLYHEGRRGGRLSMAQFDALVQYNQAHDNRFFTVIHQGIKFKQYVGVIQVGKLTIEILPKADRHSFTDADRGKWHDALFQMLRVCRLLRLEASSEAELRIRHAALHDLYIQQFLREVSQLVHKGLVKQYRQKESNRTVLTGRLEFQEHITRNLVHKERFFVRHQSYDRIHLLHEILHEALLLIPSISTNPSLADEVSRLLLAFPEMPRRKVTTALFDKISYNRKTEHYKAAIGLAKLLLLNYSPDIRGGQNPILAILFDMNELFEEYIYRQLKRAAPPSVKVRRQVSKRFWESKLIRPDIVIEKGDDTFVLDTKWKVLSEPTPSDADLKQMYAYHHYLGARRTYLLYPEVYGLRAREGQYWIPREGNLRCGLLFINVLTSEGGINEKIGDDVLKLLG